MWYFLKEDEQLLITSLTSRYVLNGPGRYFVPMFINRVRRRKGTTLTETQYARVRDSRTGEIHNIQGPGLFFLGAYEEVAATLNILALDKQQYVRIMDAKTGAIRVERGENSIILTPNEELVRDEQGELVRNAVNIDEDRAVIVRSISTGQQRLIAEPQVFMPTTDDEIVRTQVRIKLEDHETVVVKLENGSYQFRNGTDTTRSFFLMPHTELVTFQWASGIRKEARNLRLTKLDRRPKFMWYDFEVRTADNVELVIGITFFWQIMDVVRMVSTTDDTTGDICAHSRSLIIQAVSRTTLEGFLSHFNRIVSDAVIDTPDPFNAERGVRIHAVEVRSITCKDARTQETLNEIIQETTNRLNRLQKQESENEVRLRQIEGQIEAERRRTELLALQREGQRMEALAKGEAEAERVRAFFEGLANLPDAERLEIYRLLRKQDVLQAVSGGKAQIFFTPADVNLSIESK